MLRHLHADMQSDRRPTWHWRRQGTIAQAASEWQGGWWLLLNAADHAEAVAEADCCATLQNGGTSEDETGRVSSAVVEQFRRPAASSQPVGHKAKQGKGKPQRAGLAILRTA